jgi:glutaredoxin-like YruB-family protein
MDMKELHSGKELQNGLAEGTRSYLLLWKQGSEQSECALKACAVASSTHPGIPVFTAEVTAVRDIHGAYGISTVPSLLLFEGHTLKNVFKGCHGQEFYTALLEEAVYRARADEAGVPPKSVTVYSTPTCTWCNTLKQWLRKNHVPYTDIDVSRDERAAQELVRRTGQQGVPQTDINGQIVVGFDQARLKQLLEIQ